jgi:PAS domain S-box-containing protein
VRAAVGSDALIQMSLLGEAIDGAPVAVFVFEENGRHAAVNRYACRLLGYSREELLSMRLGDLAVSRDDEVEGHSPIVGGDEPEGITRVRCKDGTELSLRFRGSETTVAGMSFYVSVAWPED